MDDLINKLSNLIIEEIPQKNEINDICNRLHLINISNEEQVIKPFINDTQKIILEEKEINVLIDKIKENINTLSKILVNKERCNVKNEYTYPKYIH